MARAIGRGEIRLYRFSHPDKQRPVVRAHEGERHRLFISRHCGTHHFHRTPSELLLTEADGMKGTRAVNLHNVVTVSKARAGWQCSASSA